MGGHEASVYGEVLPEGIQTLLDVLDTEMPITQSDVFVDLGSGTQRFSQDVHFVDVTRMCRYRENCAAGCSVNTVQEGGWN